MNVFAIVTELVLQAAKPDEVSGDTRLKEDLGMDSLAMTRLIVDLEERLDIEIDLSLLTTDNLETVSDVCKLAEKSMEQRT